MITEVKDREAANEWSLPMNDDHLIFSWNDKVLFSATMRGALLDCHIAAKKEGKKELRTAVNEFCEEMFNRYSWCKFIGAHVYTKNKSVINLVKKCGFVKIGESKQASEVYVLCRQ